MSLINVENVEILNNPCGFFDDFQLKITFECLPPGLQEELEWKLIYVGSAENETFDQELDAVMVGPVVIGRNEFVFEAPHPDPEKIPRIDIVSLTVILLIGSYKDNEFIRIGYYLTNQLNTDILNNEETQWTPELLDKYADNTTLARELQRNIAVDKPRITRFPIDWDMPNPDLVMPLNEIPNEDNQLVDNNVIMQDESSKIDNHNDDMFIENKV